MSKISKWTLSIKDRSISSEWQAYCEKNVMQIMPPLIGFHLVFVALDLTELFNERILSIPRASISVISCAVTILCYFLTRKTGNFIYMRFFPVVF